MYRYVCTDTLAGTQTETCYKVHKCASRDFQGSTRLPVFPAEIQSPTVASHGQLALTTGFTLLSMLHRVVVSQCLPCPLTLRDTLRSNKATSATVFAPSLLLGVFNMLGGRVVAEFKGVITL